MKTIQEIQFEKNVKLREKYNKAKTNIPFEQWILKKQEPIDVENIFGYIFGGIFAVGFLVFIIYGIFNSF